MSAVSRIAPSPVEHHRRRQVAQRGLRGEELAEPVAVLIEQGLGARHVDRHRVGVGANRLRVLADIGVGDDEGVLHHRAGPRREQPVEAAVERHARDDGDENRRQGGDDREQGDDLDVEACRRPAPPPRLENMPDLAADDAEQQQDRERVHPEQGDDHVVGGLDRGEAGEHDEGRAGRQQRHADGRRPDQAGGESCRFGRRLGSLRGQRVSDSDRSHELPSCPLAPRRNSQLLRRECRE